MRLLITGGAGFIGSSVVRKAISRGYEVINFDALTYAGCLDNLKSIENSSFYNFVKGDICDRAEVRSIFHKYQPNRVLHLAAESHVDRSIDGPGAFVQTNIVGTYNLLEEARDYWFSIGKDTNFRFHHISTDEVFGSLGVDGFFTENSKYEPNNPYSASKASSDHLVRAWGETFGLPIVITNCSNNYGPFQFPEKLIPVVILNALSRKSIPVYGTGENIRDWLYVEDHAEALLTVLEKGRTSRTYNIGGLNEVKNIDLVKMVCGKLDVICPDNRPYEDLIEFVGDRPGHDKRYAIDATRIREELGWSPSVTLEEGLELTVKWYVENQGWLDALHSRNGVGQRIGLNA